MTTLTSPPLSNLLTQLFKDASQSSAALAQLSTNTSAEERNRLMTSKTEYREMYTRMKDFHLAVSPETGALLYMLARAGRVSSTKCEPSKIAKAQANINAAGLADLVEIREGDALQTLASGLPEQI